VLRLKRLIDKVHAGHRVLYLIDEIFRGTNNRERNVGSRAVIRSLLTNAGGSLGFVSTHDLELTSLEETLPQVVNLHFREDIRGGEMLFSYRLQSGPCPTTNALVIMERAGLDLREI
jgi:DNA mismatch repair ATPase MutS